MYSPQQIQDFVPGIHNSSIPEARFNIQHKISEFCRRNSKKGVETGDLFKEPAGPVDDVFHWPFRILDFLTCPQ